MRTAWIVALGLIMSGGIAMAQPADQPPPPQSSNADAPPPPSDADVQHHRDDLFCRREAADETGYMTPGQAARNQQAHDTIAGTALGAAAGALIGAGGGNAGVGAAVGAGAGLLAGSAVGADNARAAAHDVEQQYAAAYYACMANGGAAQPPAGYGTAPPSPNSYPYPYPYYYGPYPYPPPPPYYYYGPVFVPSVTFGFGFGGYHHGWHHHR